MMRRLNEISKGKNQFGLRVVEELYVLGKNQMWLSKQCGVSRQYISQIINGKGKPSPQLTQKIADVLGLNVFELRRLVLRAS
jgi:transcriptional regulator with XRE-family HTH domain